jgi:GT2 family glycosyltransferase
MAANGINAVRTYTVPPSWLLDAAQRHGLWVMVGIPWEQHIAFLDEPGTADAIEERVRQAVLSCGGHPAILCFTIGNEIPASIVRWHGREKIERFLKRLYTASKQEDPAALVTYVNFPSTEYLQLDFLDFYSFNVYLEQEDRLEAYFDRLQNLTGNRPLILAEVGLDSRRNGVAKQAEVLDWQIQTAFSTGCAGVFVFAWTDEWSRGGFEIEDWDFGLTTRNRKAKPALQIVASAYRDAPFRGVANWPRISVVVCSYNGERLIGQTLAKVLQSDYPDYEVIVVNDGSKDATPRIAASFPQVRLISVENGGLSAARNIGMRAATGEIIAYIDDDAYPDPHWLHYLGAAFRKTSHAAIGGPNIPPPGDGPIAECVANAPGGPIHVLLTDQIAEHIPGCNFAVRRAALEQIGGFDPVYRVAGDDVDACWRLQEIGTIGFAPAAAVWHHRRNSLKAYWRQQRGYGRAEALLERKWPRRYSPTGHLSWKGKLYGTGVLREAGRRWHVYHGVWGSAPFQALYEPAPGLFQSLAQMPEWYLIIGFLTGLSALGFLWKPLFWSLVPLAIANLLPLAQALVSARRAQFASQPSRPSVRFGLTALTALLFVVQPIARLRGRMAHGLTPWRKRARSRASFPVTRVRKIWSEKWRSPEVWLEKFETVALSLGFAHRGGDFDDWDLQIRGGLAGGARVRLAVEEHGAGRQLLRWQVRCTIGKFVPGLAGVLLLLSITAFLSSATAASAVLALAVAGLIAWIYRDCSLAAGIALDALTRIGEEQP